MPPVSCGGQQRLASRRVRKRAGFLSAAEVFRSSLFIGFDLVVRGGFTSSAACLLFGVAGTLSSSLFAACCCEDRRS